MSIFIGLSGTPITVSATNNSFAVAHEFSRPRLAVRLTGRASLRHSIPARTLCVLIPSALRLVGLSGIEPDLHAPHACVLPVYYSPPEEMLFVGPPGIEPGLHAPEACVLPTYSGPTQNTSRVRSAGIEPATLRV